MVEIVVVEQRRLMFGEGRTCGTTQARCLREVGRGVHSLYAVVDLTTRRNDN